MTISLVGVRDQPARGRSPIEDITFSRVPQWQSHQTHGMTTDYCVVHIWRIEKEWHITPASRVSVDHFALLT